VSGQIEQAPEDGGLQQALGERVADADLAGDASPPYLYPDYVATRLRAPKQPLVILPGTETELTGPAFGEGTVGEIDHDLTRQHAGEPIGQRIIVAGRLLDADGRPIRGQLVEVWQANAAGRYVHKVDQHPAPLDPNFTGAGRCLTDDEGNYRFVTIKPGAYPWQNHDNAWRPAHIHFSVFGRAFTNRLVTQMYFPDDPLFDYDPIFQSVRDPKARERMISSFDLDLTVPSWAHGYAFDIVVGGPAATLLDT
jgi:protocatechuate 3,4-dioxygenase beta subunit